jgi:hypothetical protein
MLSHPGKSIGAFGIQGSSLTFHTSWRPRGEENRIVERRFQPFAISRKGHGGRRNVSTELLDRWLGQRVEWVERLVRRSS